MNVSVPAIEKIILSLLLNLFMLLPILSYINRKIRRVIYSIKDSKSFPESMFRQSKIETEPPIDWWSIISKINHWENYWEISWVYGKAAHMFGWIRVNWNDFFFIWTGLN